MYKVMRAIPSASVCTRREQGVRGTWFNTVPDVGQFIFLLEFICIERDEGAAKGLLYLGYMR